VRRWPALVLVALVAASCEATADPPIPVSLAEQINSAEPGAVVRVSAGRYPGPLTIDKPLELVGEAGTVIVGTADQPALSVLGASGVAVSNITIEGGKSGIDVRNASDVRLDNVTIREAWWHGIFAQDASIAVTNCVISDLKAQYPQGIEINNSDARPPSLVEGCVILGPVLEGVVSHISHVTFRNNEVIGSTERGVAVTEMSRGRMEGNVVSGAIGAAFYCGDNSRCSVIDNAAEGVAAQGVGFRSSEGHGLVVHFQSEAFVDRLEVREAMGEDIMVMLDSRLVSESLYP
jgi:nitrous oxidase accessory protein NosD